MSTQYKRVVCDVNEGGVKCRTRNQCAGANAAAEPKVQIVGAFPKESHPAIIYPVAITSFASHPDAPSFLSFLGSAPAIGVFEKRGFIFLR